MDSINLFQNKEFQNQNKKILLEIALTLNKELFDENKITYKMFKYTEDNLLKDLKKYQNLISK